MTNAKPTDRVPLSMSAGIARHLKTFKEYSQLSGIPMQQLLDECLTEYIERPVQMEELWQRRKATSGQSN